MTVIVNGHNYHKVFTNVEDVIFYDDGPDKMAAIVKDNGVSLYYNLSDYEIIVKK